MLNPTYERHLLRQHNANSSLEARPFTAALPPSGGLPGSNSVLSSVMAPPAKIRHISVMSQPPCCRNIGDRFIPTRPGNKWQTKFATITEDGHSGLTTKKATENGKWNCDGLVYSCLLKNELLDAGLEKVKDQYDERGALVPLNGRNLFQYTLPDLNGKGFGVQASSLACCSLSAVSAKSHKLLRTAKETTNIISSGPFKVLAAPMLADDFYLNLVDWSSQNVLSVGLGSRVYLRPASTEQVTRLCNLSASGDSVTSVAWNERGNLLAIGTKSGSVQVWDVTRSDLVKVMKGQSGRVDALAWNGDVLTSGSYNGLILERDVRTPSLDLERRSVFHEREVCGLKWSPCKQYLASGGNDNRLLVWDSRSVPPIQDYTEHSAAVKAIAWSPHHRGLLAMGGGSADRCLHIWDALTGQAVKQVDTGSQVSNVAWSKHSPELVSTHGDFQKQIIIWKYPGLMQLASLGSHTARVLYMAMSPDGESVATGGGDETLCYWNVFSTPHSQKENTSVLKLFTGIR